VGEALKRKRVARFDHQNHRHYQSLIDGDLFRLARSTDTRFEINVRLSNGGEGLAVGSDCLIRPNRVGDFEVVHGNIVVAGVPSAARDALSAWERIAPALNGLFPCRVIRLGTFGAITLELKAEADNDT
jgi:hypothetical protein